MTNVFPQIFKYHNSGSQHLLIQHLKCSHNCSPCLWSQLAQMHTITQIDRKHEFDDSPLFFLEPAHDLPSPTGKSPIFLTMHMRHSMLCLNLYFFLLILHQQGIVRNFLGKRKVLLIASLLFLMLLYLHSFRLSLYSTSQ